MSKPSISRFLLLASICWLAITPCLWYGSPSGHDFEFHMFSWMETVHQWKQGTLYPRWAELAHWGYGEARFLFYPPASWTLGATLGAVFPWRMVPEAYCWIALMAAGTAMYGLAREWLRPPDALFAAAFYAVNPYHLLIVYWRSAYAELLAATLVPLLLLCILRLQRSGVRPILWLSLTLASAWMMNIPAAVMLYYSAAGLAVLVSLRERSLRPMIKTGIAMALGVGLASFYLLPAVLEQKWINIGEVMAPGVRPQDNFLFTTTSDPDHNRFNLMVSFLALAEIGALGLALWFSRRERVRKDVWMALSALGVWSTFAMTSASNLLWEHLPKFRFVQLPFRWLLCLNAALALLLAIATERPTALRWTARTLAVVALLATIVLAGQRMQPPWWDTAPDIREMSNSVSDGTGYEGTDEYVPAGADPYELNKKLSRVSDEGGAAVSIRTIEWKAEDKHFTISSNGARDLTVRLFNYPAWTVLVNGKPVATQTSEVTGLMIVSVPGGESDVRIHFARTSDRTLGRAISLLCALAFGFTFIKTRTTVRGIRRMALSTVLVATSNPGKLRDFAGVAAAHGMTMATIPGFSSLPPVVEDGSTFEANARKKAEEYSRAVPGEMVIADDSGLEIEALHGAPGVYSARYAAEEPHRAESNSDDEANNSRVLRELAGLPREKRAARFVCVLAAARDGQTLGTFLGTAEGLILDAPRGNNGFGYDPLFYFPQIGKTFAELDAREKARYGHRGAAFRKFLEWCGATHR